MGKQRPRFSRGRTYTPEKTVEYQQRVQNEAVQVFAAPSEKPIKLRVYAYFEPPKSWGKKKRNERIFRPHTQRPDIDNIEKIIADALNGIAYKDDAQICESTCRKYWGRTGQVAVIVEELA